MQGTLIHCEAFYDTDTHRIVLHVPEELKPKQEEPNTAVQLPRRRGRPTIYSSDEERKAKHREQALRHYYRKKALQEATSLAALAGDECSPGRACSFESSKKEQQNSHSDDGSHSAARPPDEVRVTINTNSKTLGDISEDITFKRVNGRLRKQR